MGATSSALATEKITDRCRVVRPEPSNSIVAFSRCSSKVLSVVHHGNGSVSMKGSLNNLRHFESIEILLMLIQEDQIRIERLPQELCVAIPTALSMNSLGVINATDVAGAASGHRTRTRMREMNCRQRTRTSSTGWKSGTIMSQQDRGRRR